MACNFNIKVVEQNDFTICIPLKKRTFVASTPIDEDVDILALEDLSVKIGGAVFPATRDAAGVMVDVSRDALARGTYDVVLTATYKGHAIKAAYFDSLTIVEWNCQSDAQQCVQGSPIMFEAGFVIYSLTDAELAALKEEYRLKIAAAQQAKEEAEQAKEEYIAKAEALDDVAQQSTLTQGVTNIREDISHIDIDTSNLAKQGSDAGATNTAIKQAILDNAGVPTMTIPDTTSAQELAPNVLYIFATRTSTLTLTLGTPIVGIANEYHFFVVCGSTAPTINFPSGISWNGGSEPTIAADKTYEISILNNVAAYFEI